MKKIKLIISRVIDKNNQKVAYLFIGGFNTIFGYLNSLLLFYVLSTSFDILLIIFLINFLNITFSFLTLKFFVFKSKGKIFIEYFKALFLYSWLAVIGGALLYFLFEILGIQFYISSLITTLFIVILSYYANYEFTFKK